MPISAAIDAPRNRPYQWNFVRELKARVRRKARLFPAVYDTGPLRDLKPGMNNDALFMESTLAFEPRTGKLAWYERLLRWLRDEAGPRVAVAGYYQGLAGVRRHGMYVWGEDWREAKRHAECYDYLLDIAAYVGNFWGRDPEVSRRILAQAEVFGVPLQDPWAHDHAGTQTGGGKTRHHLIGHRVDLRRDVVDSAGARGVGGAVADPPDLRPRPDDAVGARAGHGAWAMERHHHRRQRALRRRKARGEGRVARRADAEG